MKRIYLLFSLLIGCIYLHAAIYNVMDFGAKADGKTIDSPVINRAIEAAAQAGGGTVYLPAGEYACYSIRLKSNIHIYLEQGTRIIAAFPGKEEGYDTAEPNEHNKYQDFGHSHWKNSLIWGIGLENITISGVKYPYQFVKSRLLLLEESHIEYVLDCLHENTREVKNIKAYLLTCLMNSITTIGNYYQAKVNHDMYGGGI